jgi:YbbR domain-containing protein
VTNDPGRKKIDRADDQNLLKKEQPAPREKQSLFSRIQNYFVFKALFSLFVALFLWLMINASYVNPPGTKTVYAPVTLLNRSALDELEIELKSGVFPNTVNVHVKGRQEDLDKLSPGNFEAVLDFAQATSAADTKLKVELRSANTENVSIVSVEPSEIPIELELRKTRTLDVEVQFTGDPADGFRLTNYTRFPSTKSFSGRESLVDSLGKVDVLVDITGLAGNTTVHQQCRVFDTEGKEIKRIEWEQVFDVTLEISKEVPVVADITGNPANDYYVLYTTVSPESVELNGTREALEKVDSLYAETLDIAQKRESITEERALLLPNNVKLSGDVPPRAVVDVTIKKYQFSLDIKLSKARVELLNRRPEYRYEIAEGEVALLLKGKGSDIASLTSDDISAVVNVAGLTPGTHAVPATVTLPEGIVGVNDVVLTVVIAANPPATTSVASAAGGGRPGTTTAVSTTEENSSAESDPGGGTTEHSGAGESGSGTDPSGPDASGGTASSGGVSSRQRATPTPRSSATPRPTSTPRQTTTAEQAEPSPPPTPSDAASSASTPPPASPPPTASTATTADTQTDPPPSPDTDTTADEDTVGGSAQTEDESF